VSPRLGVTRWGGQDSNLRPTDYESVPEISATCGSDPERPSDQRFLYPTARMSSGSFPVRRGADAGQIVTNSREKTCLSGMLLSVERMPILYATPGLDIRGPQLLVLGCEVHIGSDLVRTAK
jgi:hypothetical protein